MFYPGTGAHDATGTGPGQGFSVNVPWLTGGMGNGDYMAAFQHVLLPIAYEFNPTLIIVSAGFDAAIGDPIGGYALLVSSNSCILSLFAAACLPSAADLQLHFLMISLLRCLHLSCSAVLPMLPVLYAPAMHQHF